MQQIGYDEGTYAEPEVSFLDSFVSWNQALVGRCAHSDEPEVFIQLYGTCLPRKGAPATQGPAPASPVTVTRTQVTRLLAKGSGITRQPRYIYW